MAKNELTIPQTDEPTIFNNDAAIGAFVAPIVSIPVTIVAAGTAAYLAEPDVVSSVIEGSLPLENITFDVAKNMEGAATFASRLTSVGAMLTGGLIGGSIGKAEMQKFAKEGKPVKTPTYFNWDAVGYGLGALVLASIGGISASFISEGLGSIVGNLGLIASPVAAAYGAFTGKAEMQKDYDLAIEQLQEKARVQERTMQKAQAVLMGQGEDLHQGKSFAAAEEARRAQSGLLQR